ncbi:uncharacterized protein LOC123501606 [Portunus trituberculatus]|uniref:uncharacterized protein LOC123501606 n=1 Tax=Portunus trituberculatus TaxID=210409 RepID=UPI001E1CF5EF|nr:uncharacterized protein LOC123501606 [Portunus trituberculatus]
MRGSRGGEREAKSPQPEEENIMNLLPRPPVLVRKPKRYVSQHHGRVVEEARGRDSHATLGKAVSAHPPSPAHYLKKGHRDQYTHALVSSKYALTAEDRPHICPKRPPLPTPVPYPPSERDRCAMNWVAGNMTRVEEAARARRSAGALRKHVAVDSLAGHRQDRLSAGLHPRYVFKKNFGSVPSYLERRKKSLSAQKEEERKERGSARKKREGKKEEGKKKEEEQYTLLPEEEKEELLKGLHTNLKEAQRRLQSLPVVCETLASRARRDELEKKVMDLQRYIFLLQNHTLAVSE